jgi:F0F1-type ATP synthase membrane subunit a
MTMLTTIQTLAAAGGHSLLDHVLPHDALTIGGVKITNHVVMLFLSAFLTLIVFSYIGAKARNTLVPTGIHNFFESMLSFFRTEVFRPALGENADKFAPFLWTVFFFVLFCNLLGMIPLGEMITLASQGNIEPIWGTATANFSVTGGLAILAFVTVHAAGIVQQIRIKMDPSLAPHHAGHDHSETHGHGQTHGAVGPHDERDVVQDHHVGDGHDHAHGMHHSKDFGGEAFPVAVVKGVGSYIWNFAPHPDAGGKLGSLALFCLLLVLEVIGSLVKPFSLCVRLFANMVAGHLVLAALIGLIPVGIGVAAAATYGIGAVVVLACTALSLLELFVAFLQAYIFTFLCTLYIASAVAPEH